MKIPLEIFRVLFIICIGLIIVTFTDGLVFNLPFNSQYLLIPFLMLWLYLVIVVLTNFKNKAIRFYWKKEKKVLNIPFGSCKMLAYDEDGNTYKLGLFFIPNLTN